MSKNKHIQWVTKIVNKQCNEGCNLGILTIGEKLYRERIDEMPRYDTIINETIQQQKQLINLLMNNMIQI